MGSETNIHIQAETPLVRPGVAETAGTAARSRNRSGGGGEDDSGGESEGGEDGALWARQARFFLERYKLYTVSGDRLYSGTVIHQPWPVLPAQLHILQESLSTAVPGLPATLGAPAHCCFSEGVGPVDFEMLRPCRTTTNASDRPI